MQIVSPAHILLLATTLAAVPTDPAVAAAQAAEFVAETCSECR
jgi:hypothetical protein